MNLLGTDTFSHILVIAWAGCGIIQLIYYLLIFLPVLRIRRRQLKEAIAVEGDGKRRRHGYP